MKKFFCFFWFFIFFYPLAAAETKPTVCLNMIVKDEAKVIRRCLESVIPIIDYWIIVDTGSTDDTQTIIKEYLKNIPGQLYERPWHNFGYNRNEALQIAKDKADYLLFIDADEILIYENDFKLPNLEKDFYYIMTNFNHTTYARAALIKSALNWHWKGALHESLDSNEARTSELLKGVINHVYTDGARSQDPDKYKKDVKILEEALRQDPHNVRDTFYLAQSYKDAGDYVNSIKFYQKRIEMGGWQEEIFWSMLQIGFLKEILKKPSKEISNAFFKAYHYRPSRLEPLYYLANFYRLEENYALGYLIANIAKKIPFPNDFLFNQKWMYDYGILLELSICAYWIGNYEECASTCQELLKQKNLPKDIQECIEKNLNFANLKLIEKISYN